MKNLLKFLPVVMLALSMASCNGEVKDWTCTCVSTPGNVEVSTRVITDTAEKDAEKDCDNGDASLLGVGQDCEIS